MNWRLTANILSLAVLLIMFIGLLTPIDSSLPIWVFIDRLGDAEGYIVLTLAIYFLIDAWLGYFSLLILLVSGVSNIWLKDLFRIPRPDDSLVEAEGYSFPSGHAQTSSTFWSSIYYLTRDRVVAIIGIPVVAIISVSRLVLKVHYPLDVAAGLVIGLLIGYGVKYVVKFYRETWSLKISLHIILGSLALILYLGSGYLTLVKIGGVAFGMVLHPILHREVRYPFRTRLYLYILYLIPAFLLTRLASDASTTFIVFLLIGAGAPFMLYRLGERLSKMI